MAAPLETMRQELQKGNEMLTRLLDEWNGTAHPRKRTFNPLPLVDSKTNLELWDSRLRATLGPHNLLRYLDTRMLQP